MPCFTKLDDPLKKTEIWGRKASTPLNFFYQLFRKLDNGFSVIILIVGNQRDGKSFLGVYIAWMIHQAGPDRDKEFDPTKITFYDPDEAINSLKAIRRGSVLIDEAGAILNRRLWYEKVHQDINKVVNTQANKNNCYIFITPFASDIDTATIKHMDFLILVKKRGRFLVSKIKKKFGEIDQKKAFRPWILDDCNLRMKDMPKDIWQRYKLFSDKKKEEMLEDIAAGDDDEKPTDTEKIRIQYEELYGRRN